MKRVVSLSILLSLPVVALEGGEEVASELHNESSQVIEKKESQEEPEWGLAIGSRTAEFAFEPVEHIDNGKVSDLVTRFYYAGDYVFLRGDHGGVHLYQQPTYNFNAIAQVRFFDIPASMQNEFHGTNIDLGLQLEYFFTKNMPIQFEYMSDVHGNDYGNIKLRYAFDYSDFDFKLYSALRLKSADFNNLYYGLDGLSGSKNPDGSWNENDLIDNKIGADYDLSVGIDTRYHVWRNLYLLAEAKITRLNSKTYHNAVINSPTQGEYFLGFGFFKDKKRKNELTMPENHYVRWAYGWGTPSNLGDILAGDAKSDPFNNQMTSFFYGIPLTESLFGSDIELFLTPGLVYHFESGNQDRTQEYVMAIKAYYTIKWPLRWRLGFAEGISYRDDVSGGLEYEEIVNEKGYAQASKLLNYLDVSIDFNVGDLTRVKELKSLWLGYSIHHRSAIFENSSLFGRIKGGSNYNTVYLQWHF